MVRDEGFPAGGVDEEVLFRNDVSRLNLFQG